MDALEARLSAAELRLARAAHTTAGVIRSVDDLLAVIARLDEAQDAREAAASAVALLEHEPAPAPAVVASPDPAPEPEAHALGCAASVADPEAAVEVAPHPVPAPAPGARRRPRLSGLVPLAMFTVGGLATADAIATIAWQEPLSSLYTSHQQTELRRRLATLDAQPLIPAVKLPPSPAERMAKLAVALEHHATSGSPLGRVSMPSIHSSFVLVQGTGEASLKRGPGHYATTVLPGLRGTVGLAGHRTTYLAPFRRINELRKGARILLEMPYGRFEYRVSGTQIVKPTDTKALRPSHEDRLVLTACHPLYSAAERIVVTAELRTAEPRGAARRTV